MNNQQQDAQETQERPAKRTKIRLACQECRDRKIRCDGGKPCGSCTRKKLKPEQCIYSEPVTEIAPSYVKSLETRIRELEQTRERNESVAQIPLQQDIVDLQGDADYPNPSPNLDENAYPNPHNNASADYDQSSAYRQEHHSTRQDLSNGAQQTPNTFASLRMPPPETTSQFDALRSPQRRSMPNAFASPPEPHQMPGFVFSQEHPESFERGGFGRLPPQTSVSQSTEPVEDQVASAMGATEGTPPSAKNAGSVFLGPSSAAAFMNLIRKNSRKRTHSEVIAGTPSSTTSKISKAPSSKDKELIRALMEDMVLPPRRVADEYLSSYWAHVHPFYPILHQSTFMAKYDKLWNNHDLESGDIPETVYSIRAFFSIFNVVLALGCQHLKRTNQTPKANNNAQNFFDRSQYLITPDSQDHGSLQLVQAHVLAAQYLQGSDKINRCSCSLGLAIRVAQGIGIQLDDPGESQVDREERRRTWWGCVLMDRVLSMTFGRPPMVIWPSVVPFPAPVDDINLSAEPGSSSQPFSVSVPSKLSFFVQALKLSDILIDVLKYFYTPRVEHREITPDGFHLEDCDPLLEIDSRLERWSDGVPEFLQYEAEGGGLDERGIFRAQAITLQCRYLHLKILLFRPVTVDIAQSRYLDSMTASKRSMLKQAFITGCIESCISAAQTLIHVLSATHNKEQLPVWWYSVFYLYTAGTVILAVLLTPTLRLAQHHNLASLEMSFAMCINSLSFFAEADGGFAKSCLLILHRAYNHETRPETQSSYEDKADGAAIRDPDYEMSTTMYDGRLEANDLALTNNTFLDSFWPNGGIEWLNSIPLEFGNAPVNMGFTGY